MFEKQGVLLAGGYSRRFGTPKAFAERDGINFYKYSIQAMAPFTDSISIVTNSTLEQKFMESETSYDVYVDLEEFQGQGPLVGILTVMERTEAEWYVTAPVDVPFIDQEIYKRLTEAIDDSVHIVVPIVADKIQPLIGLYHHSLKGLIKRQLEHGKRAPKQLFEHCCVKFVQMSDENKFLNINRQVDYDKYINKREQSQ
ncbi:molybdenum cofactor guanylyltransferase [Ornithinibacillus halophilus]|uniref:Probable molybdenum cofactor guanylyltransferase n=1 Tax=Ornithinibacillus halophilus TaxID=930117 RepID=A0A1M5FLS8_9BACI|nr:molybdenum cofactor guanylyltransferase [Ornithinibacillus halophilus]SHF92379.1 molybdenum cofactor guanylyltransferase [Ornithinibacillus halophilus]